MTKAKILIYDLETSQLTAESWGPKWQANLNRVTEDSHLLSFGDKWLGEDEVHVVSQLDFPRAYKRNRRDDRQLTGTLRDLFLESDVRIAHNAKKFDEKVAKARMAQNGFTNVPKVPIIDTLPAARRHFRLPSYSLNDIAAYFDLGAKLQHTGLHLWQAVAQGDMEAWQLMIDYNEQDVWLLERLYLFLRDGGWIDNHPNMATILGERWICPHCAANRDRLQKRGIVARKTMSYQQWFCKDCNSYSYQRKSGSGPALTN